MKNPRAMRLEEFMNHHDREVRGAACELMRTISMTQLEERASSIPLYVEELRTSHLIKDNFRPLS